MRVIPAPYDYEKLAERCLIAKMRRLFDEELSTKCEYHIPGKYGFWAQFLDYERPAGCRLGAPCGCTLGYCPRIKATKADRDRALREVKQDPEAWL